MIKVSISEQRDAGGKENEMYKKILSLILVLIFAAFMVTGCGAPQETEPVEDDAPVVEDTMMVIGGDLQTEYTKMCEITNSTGMDIVGFTIRVNGMSEYPDNMMPEGSVLKVGDKCRINYTPEDAETLYMGVETDSEKLLEPQFDAQITFADDTQLEWYAIPFDDMREAQLCKDGDVIYVIYTSITTDEEINTLEAAKQNEGLAEDKDTSKTKSDKDSKDTDADKTTDNSGASKPNKPNSGSNGNSGSSSSSSTGGSSGGDSGCIGDEGLVYEGNSGSSGGSSSGGSTSGSGSSGGSTSGGSSSGGDSGCIGDEGLTY